ncbi:MAG: hypothetical protein ACLQBJ_14670 [Bryobacteraceae bacterium]
MNELDLKRAAVRMLSYLASERMQVIAAGAQFRTAEHVTVDDPNGRKSLN